MSNVDIAATTLGTKPRLGSPIANTGWLVGDRIFRMGVGLVVGVWVARYLGPEGYGLLSYAGAWVFLFSFLSSLGLDVIAIRELVGNQICPDKVMGTAFGLKLIGGVTVLVLATSVAYVVDRGEPRTLILIALAAIGTVVQSTDVLDYHFQALVQSRYIALARGVAFQILSVVKIGLILLKASLIAFAAAGLAETVLGASLLWVMYRKTVHPETSWRWDSSTAVRMLRDSWPLMFSALMVTLFMRVDQVMLKSLSSAEEIGKYAASVRLSEAWYFIPMAIATSSYPKIIQAHAISEERLNQMVRRLYAAMIIICYVIIIPMSLLSHPLSLILFGARYHGMEGMLALNSWAGLFVGIGVIRSGYLTAINRTRFYLCSMIAGACLNIALNVVLIPRYGGFGAAEATLASYALASYLSCFFYGPTRSHAWMITKLLPPWVAWPVIDWRQIVSPWRIPAVLRRFAPQTWMDAPDQKP